MQRICVSIREREGGGGVSNLLSILKCKIADVNFDCSHMINRTMFNSNMHITAQ